MNEEVNTPTLRENEWIVLNVVSEIKNQVEMMEIVSRSELPDSTVMRAILSLVEKKLLSLSQIEETYVEMNEEGTQYAEYGLPERRALQALLDLGGEASQEEVMEYAKIPVEKIGITLGWLKRKDWISLSKTRQEIVLKAIGSQPIGSDEELIKTLSEEGRVKVDNLPKGAKIDLKTLIHRNLVKTIRVSLKKVELTEEGKKLLEKQIKPTEAVNILTPELIRTGSWREVKFREYDLEIEPRRIYPNKKHMYIEFLEQVRRILIGMGFEEAEGPHVETEFWNFDCLFQAQDHPAREVHDSYLLKYPDYKSELRNKDLVERVAETHENGWMTGSKGWRYRWNLDIARRFVLRTQTTAVSMRYLSTHRVPPVKMFCLSQVFRPDVVDAKHLGAGFNQCEGIAGDKEMNFRHLLGILEAFTKAFGLKTIKFKPGYFPFTEPSVEGFCLHPRLGWMECVGAGMFRPEVLKPFDIDFPVIAWGIGIDRIAMTSLGIDDIRLLYAKDLEFLREKPII
jgi:phenylalanyl-tRNA synthetase alpha chain